MNRELSLRFPPRRDTDQAAVRILYKTGLRGGKEQLNYLILLSRLKH